MLRRRVLRLLPAVFVAACSAGELVLPAAPEAASATALLGGVRLSWTPIRGADRYVVLAATSSSFAGATTLDDATSPVDVTGLTSGTWYFRIGVVKNGFVSPGSAVISATPLTVGTAGLVPLTAPAWVASNGDPVSHFGYPATGAGDVDGDGFDDLLVGAMLTTAGGTAYLYRGGPFGLDAQPAFERASTQTGSHFSKGLSSPGDVNGDGFLDLLVGAAEHDDGFSNEGRAWLYPGTGDETYFSSAEIWTADSSQTNTYMARFAVPAGDVNGDGFDDFAVCQHAYNAGSIDEGRVNVWHGTAGSIPIAPDWMDESDQADAFFGYALSPRPGDADGDGYDDLLAGAWKWDRGGTSDVGAAFLYRGGPAGLEAEASWMEEGENFGNSFGGSLSFAGDVNGDGYDDAIVGAYRLGMDDRGRAYLYTGGPAGLSASAVWTYDGTSQDRLGMGVGAAGDVNGDGYDDLLVGAYSANAGGDDAGRVLLFLGGPGGPALAPSWEWIGDEVDGYAGGTVASAGDVNGDGSGDFAVGVVSFESFIAPNGKVRVFHGPPREGPSVSLASFEIAAGLSAPPLASFVDPASGGDASCTWDWGDGTAAEVVDPCDPADAGAPTHVFGSAGDYVMRLSVVNDYGASGRAFATVHVSSP